MTIEGFDADAKAGDQPLMTQCARELGGVDAAFASPSIPFLMECMPKVVREMKLVDPEFLAVFLLFTVEILLLMLYWGYKKGTEMVRH